jgi:hypothetical protein
VSLFGRGKIKGGEIKWVESNGSGVFVLSVPDSERPTTDELFRYGVPALQNWCKSLIFVIVRCFELPDNFLLKG